MKDALLRVRDLHVDLGGQAVLRGIDFDLCAGETVGLVGESGSGKSTLARAILRLEAARGSVEFLGSKLLSCPAEVLRARRRDLQIIFQDPLASLDPRMTVGQAIAEPVEIFEPGLDGGARQRLIGGLLERVGLGVEMAGRYPHELSGGQCQRVGIARAMILNPKLLICDEAVSSLDVSVQGQIVNLLLDLQQETAMAVLFISHNLAVVRHLSHRVLVMYLGKLVEVASSEALFAVPVHPYTRALLAAVPQGFDAAGSARAGASGPVRVPARVPARVSARLPALSEPPAGLPATPELPAGLLAWGCAFRDRCPYVLPVCKTDEPPLVEVAAGHWAACHRSQEVLIPLSFPP